MDLRGPHIQRYRRKLKRELLRPDLSSETRGRLHQALARVGEPKVYSLDEPPPPGAVDPGPMPPVEIEIDLTEATHDSLSALPHSQLYLYVRQQGLEVKPGDTKVTIISTILADRQGENP
ncbi:MAG TPA: hypothetical protein VMZ92_21805 [Planctomycetota bacterium]|nr:hypothetical protein [Planctomycetota bacterium]